MNENNDIVMLDAVERYIRGEMNPDERVYFENLRKTNPGIDQLVVEHTLFLQQVSQFGDRRDFKASLNEVHSSLADDGRINTGNLRGTAKVVYLWKKYRRVTAIAASIAGITAITISGLVNSYGPRPADPKVQELVKRVNNLDKKTRELDNKIDKVDSKTHTPRIDMTVRFNGTGFLITNKGLMVTNAHVVKNSRNIYVQNNKGDQFRAIVVKLDPNKDVAIIKIDDDNFKPLSTLPYGIIRTTSDIAEPIFTLGYPRDEIVYGEGYLSARTGYNGDTLSCQISVPANPGNSGGPVFNHRGEVIGILSARERQAESAVFAVQSKYIYKAVDELKKNKLYEAVKLNGKSSISGLNKVEQVKKIMDCVFIVKGD